MKYPKKLSKEQVYFLQTHQLIKLEFEDLLNSDSDFNYNENEFIEWLYDYKIFKEVKK